MEDNTLEKVNKIKELAEEVLWQGTESEFTERNADWFWLFGTIAILLIILAVMLGNYFLAIIVILGAFILGTNAKRQPQEISFGLTRFGVKHNETVFRYDTIHSFWIDLLRNRLIIESGRMVKPHIFIPLAGTDPEHVRALLLTILPEEEFRNTFADSVSEFFGF